MVLYDIVFCLIQLDLCILRTVTDATANRDQSLFGKDDSDHFRSLLSQELINDGGLYYYQAHEVQNHQVRQFVEGLTVQQVVERIRDLRTFPYFSRLFPQRLTLYEKALAMKRVCDTSPDVAVPAGMIQDSGEGYTESEYADYCATKFRGTVIDLESVYNIALQLRDKFAEATSRGLIDETSFERLKSKISAMQANFHNICLALGKPKQDLMRENQFEW